MLLDAHFQLSMCTPTLEHVYTFKGALNFFQWSTCALTHTLRMWGFVACLWMHGIRDAGRECIVRNKTTCSSQLAMPTTLSFLGSLESNRVY